MNIQKPIIIACAALTLATAPHAWANPAPWIVVDPSFEIGSNPLPGLGSVVGPPFAAGFWGVENAAIVDSAAACHLYPFHQQKMLQMDDEGLTVTQAFQVIDVSADSACIDRGKMSIDYSAMYNICDGNTPGQTYLAVNAFACQNCWNVQLGSTSATINLDFNPSTWEKTALTYTLPVGTRWLLIQVGFIDVSLQGRSGYVDYVQLDGRCDIPVPVAPATWGLIKALYK